jgi:hypothetical protein
VTLFVPLAVVMEWLVAVQPAGEARLLFCSKV